MSARRSSLVCGAGLAMAACSGASTAPVATPAPTVPVEAASVQFAQPYSRFAVGSRTDLLTIVRGANGAVLSDRAVAWTSSNDAVAIIAPASTGSATLTARSRGTSTITATVGALSTSVSITVTALAVWILPADEALVVGESMQLTAVSVDAGGAPLADQPPVSWKSSKPAVTAVNGSGLVTTAAAGSASITASADGLDAAVVIESVTPGSLAAVRFVHQAGNLGTLTFRPSRGPLVPLAAGETRRLRLSSGLLSVYVDGLPASSSGGVESFLGNLLPDYPVSIYVVGAGAYGHLIPVSDAHGPVANDETLVRVVMASEYAESYSGNNLFVVDQGHALDGTPFACYFDLGAATGFLVRRAGSFDIVLEDPPYYAQGIYHAGHEFKRFSVTAQPGQATTFVISGPDPASMRLATVVDP